MNIYEGINFILLGRKWSLYYMPQHCWDKDTKYGRRGDRSAFAVWFYTRDNSYGKRFLRVCGITLKGHTDQPSVTPK